MVYNNENNMKPVLVEFNLQEEFTALDKAQYLTLTLITNGKAMLNVNEKMIVLAAPCVYLSSRYDKIVLLESTQFEAKSLNFHPAFINKEFTFEALETTRFDEVSDEHDHSLVSPFLTRNEFYNGIVNPLPQKYLHISEWFDLASKESRIKSDRYWLHRVRRYLLQILLSLEDAYTNGSNLASEEAIIDIILDHIHTNYANEITLDSLCKLVYMNRTSLNRRFKAYTRRSPIDYLLHHRLNIACELLTHSNLSISKIVEMTGFKYESYFSRQFTAKIGMTPTQYRQSDGFETLNTEESRIVDEF